MRNVLSLLVMTAVLLALGGCKDQGAGKDATKDGPGGGKDEVDISKDIPVGVFLSLTGGNADFGLSTKYGIDLAVEQINGTGGVNGKPLRIIEKDIASDKKDTGVQAEALASKENILCAVGAVESSLSLVAAPVFQKNGIPMITPSSTNPRVTEQGDYIFRICYIDSFQGAACADFTFKHLQKRKALMIVEQGNDYARGLADYYKLRFEKLGGIMLPEQQYPQGETNFKSVVSNIAKAAEQPDAIFIPGYYGDTPLIAKELKAQGVTCVLVGGDGWESPNLVASAGTALEGCYFGIHYNVEDTEGKTRDFVKAFKAKFTGDKARYLNSMAALGYDAIYVLKAALEKSKSGSRKALRDALAGIKGFAGASDKFDIDANRNARKAITMLRIEGNDWKFVKKIKPEDVE